jgi:hypothetical protein
MRVKGKNFGWITALGALLMSGCVQMSPVAIEAGYELSTSSSTGGGDPRAGDCRVASNLISVGGGESIGTVGGSACSGVSGGGGTEGMLEGSAEFMVSIGGDDASQSSAGTSQVVVVSEAEDPTLYAVLNDCERYLGLPVLTAARDPETSGRYILVVGADDPYKLRVEADGAGSCQQLE